MEGCLASIPMVKIQLESRTLLVVPMISDGPQQLHELRHCDVRLLLLSRPAWRDPTGS